MPTWIIVGSLRVGCDPNHEIAFTGSIRRWFHDYVSHEAVSTSLISDL